MTPQRIKEFEEQINYPPYSSARTRRIIRQAVNEALEEAASACDVGVKWEPALPRNMDTVSKEVTRMMAKTVRASKLP